MNIKENGLKVSKVKSETSKFCFVTFLASALKAERKNARKGGNGNFVEAAWIKVNHALSE